MRINAKFGSCSKCGIEFESQELIEWQRDKGSWHIDCMPDDSIPSAMDLLESHALADRLGFDNPPTPIASKNSSVAKPKTRRSQAQLKF